MTMDEIKKLANETPNSLSSVAESVAHAEKNHLPLNLQFFATDEGGSGEDTPTEDNTEDTQENNQTDDDKQGDKKGDKTFTQAELDDIVEQRLKRAEKDKQKAIDEAKKLAKMNADEKREYEFEKLQEENKRLLAEQNKYSLGKEATKMLAESNIVATDEILNFVVREDAETTSKAVKAFSDLVDKVSDDRMKEKLKGKSPKKQTNSSGAFTKESIMAIKDGAERIKAIQENQHLFN